MARLISEQERISRINAVGKGKFIKWVGEFKNGESRCELQCVTCDYRWETVAAKASIGTNGCPKCKRVNRFTAGEYIDRVNERDGFEFVRWDGGFKNANSRAVVRCDNSHEWSVTLNCFLHLGSGCPKCHPRHSRTLTYYIDLISKIENVNFIRLNGDFRGKRSKALFQCDSNHRWVTTLENVTKTRSPSGCPKCAKYGYDQCSPGTLYAILSECTRYMKVGITKNKSQRLKQLVRSTPFPFTLYGTVRKHDGGEIRRMEHRIHSMFPNAELDGFDGCTEWLVNSVELREYLSTILK